MRARYAVLALLFACTPKKPPAAAPAPPPAPTAALAPTGPSPEDLELCGEYLKLSAEVAGCNDACVARYRQAEELRTKIEQRRVASNGRATCPSALFTPAHIRKTLRDVDKKPTKSTAPKPWDAKRAQAGLDAVDVSSCAKPSPVAHVRVFVDYAPSGMPRAVHLAQRDLTEDPFGACVVQHFASADIEPFSGEPKRVTRRVAFAGVAEAPAPKPSKTANTDDPIDCAKICKVPGYLLRGQTQSHTCEPELLDPSCEEMYVEAEAIRENAADRCGGSCLDILVARPSVRAYLADVDADRRGEPTSFERLASKPVFDAKAAQAAVEAIDVSACPKSDGDPGEVTASVAFHGSGFVSTVELRPAKVTTGAYGACLVRTLGKARTAPFIGPPKPVERKLRP